MATVKVRVKYTRDSIEKVEITTSGFVGQACLAATNSIVQRTGAKVTPTAEFFADNEKHEEARLCLES